MPKKRTMPFHERAPMLKKRIESRTPMLSKCPNILLIQASCVPVFSPTSTLRAGGVECVKRSTPQPCPAHGCVHSHTHPHRAQASHPQFPPNTHTHTHTRTRAHRAREPRVLPASAAARRDAHPAGQPRSSAACWTKAPTTSESRHPTAAAAAAAGAAAADAAAAACAVRIRCRRRYGACTRCRCAADACARPPPTPALLQ